MPHKPKHRGAGLSAAEKKAIRARAKANLKRLRARREGRLTVADLDAAMRTPAQRKQNKR